MYPNSSMFDNGHDCMLYARPPCCTYETLWPAPRQSGICILGAIQHDEQVDMLLCYGKSFGRLCKTLACNVTACARDCIFPDWLYSVLAR